ncbi:MAG: hypothetical protein GY822_05945 [Deltaproteobacteria bacterium]|nr:hypothetical protein [Deltaproteobacteria bacterium]
MSFHFLSLLATSPSSPALAAQKVAVEVPAKVATSMHHPHVSEAITYGFSALLIGMVLSLALEEKIHAKKSLITGVFAAIALFAGVATGVLPGNVSFVFLGETVTLPVFIQGVDWSVITIILASSIFVDVTSRSGLFTSIAIRLTKQSGGDPYKLLLLYGVMTVVFSAVLNNVTAMIIVGSLTGVSLKKLGREQQLLAFLLVEGLLTNIGGLLTLISSVPNIIIGQAANISFISFFITASPFVVVATAITLWMGAKLGRIEKLKGEEEIELAKSLVEGFDENDGVESKNFFIFATVMFILFIFFMAMTSVLPVLKELDMGYVAGIFALVMLVKYKSTVDEFYRGIDWDLIGFFVFLFAIINVMEHAQVLHLIGKGLAHIIDLGPRVGSAALLLASAAFSSVTDNIPLAAMLAKILTAMPEAPPMAMWWSVVFGANLGGNLTPIGSASTVVAVTVIHRYGIKFSFIDFVKTAFPYAVVQLLLGVGYVVLLSVILAK